LPDAWTKPKKRRTSPLSKKKTLELGRKYFAEDFPNPKPSGLPSKGPTKVAGQQSPKSKRIGPQPHFVLFALLPGLQPLSADTESAAFVAKGKINGL